VCQTDDIDVQGGLVRKLPECWSWTVWTVSALSISRSFSAAFWPMLSHMHIKTHCKPVDMLQMCPTMLLETAVYPCFCPWALQTLTLIHFQTQQAILKHGLHWPHSPDQRWWFCQVSLGVTPSRPEPATQSLRVIAQRILTNLLCAPRRLQEL